MFYTQKKYTRSEGFTLVELIVVVAILTVLSAIGFVGYSGYSVGSRDATRTADLKGMYQAIKVVQANTGKTPTPDSALTITTASGSLHMLQWSVGTNTKKAINLESGGKDPKTGVEYSYAQYADKKHIQLLAFYETPGYQDKLALSPSLLDTAHADNTELFPTTIGTKLGIVLDTETNLPIDDTLTGSVSLSVLAASGATTVGSPVVGTGSSVVMTPSMVSILSAPLATLAFESAVGSTTPGPAGSVVESSTIFGGGPNGVVAKVVKFWNGLLFVGDFSEYKWTSVNKSVLVDPVTGNIMAGFTPPVINGMIYDTKTQSDGKVVIVGLFTTVDGVSRNSIARLNSDGSLDSSFDPGTGFDTGIYSVGLMPSGSIVTAGPATSYNGTALPSRIAMISPNGSVDPGFDLNATALGGYYVNGLSVGPTGSIYLANENSFYKFSADGTQLASGACSGTTNQINALANGKVSITCNNLLGFQIYDGDLNLQGTYGTFATLNGWGRVYGVHPLADSSLVAVGEFTDAGGIDSQLYARYGSDGVFDPSLSGTGTNMTPAINGRYTVGAIDIDADKFLIFGAFDELRGVVVNNVAYVRK